jgi:CRISPR type III-associated protein (TIGR04423 family)
MEYKIIEGCFQGYIWKSNETKPEILDNNDKRIELNISNPFIVEAQLYDSTTMKSYAIKFIDGKYKDKLYDIAELDNKDGIEFEINEFLSNNMGNRLLCFRQYWAPLEDKLCEDMKVLNPAEFVFIGFK